MADRRKKQRKRRGIIDLINATLTLVVLGVLIVGGAVVYGAREFYVPGPVSADTTFTVERGQSLGTIAENLQSDGVVSNAWIFRLGAMALKKQSSLRHGEYRITANASMEDVLRELTEGRPIQYSITIPEGFTSWQVVSRLNADTDLSGEISAVPPEGSLMPNTYNFEKGASRQAIIDQMQAAQAEALKQVWANRAPDLPLKTPEELVTLASIVEKETGVAGERPRVAAVFINRLKKKMRLQSDPTTIYGITQGQGPLGRGLKQSEIEAKTPYNTYQIDGLPPGPIANPGLDSLEAVANPADTKDLYFVAAGASPSDGHLFAATYAEHRKNVAKWRAIEKQQAAAAEADAQAAKDAVEADQAAQSGDAGAAPASAN
ncbi:MAG TPA: endolytic transglycosylase MltG [Devosiaceae bacterium]